MCLDHCGDDGQAQASAFGPATPELTAAATKLLQFYRERPVTLIRIIYARANDRLKAFAEAFRLR